MAISQLLTEARQRRSARLVARKQYQTLVRELSAYRTPAERAEIELLARRSGSAEAEEVLDIMYRLPIREFTRSA